MIVCTARGVMAIRKRPSIEPLCPGSFFIKHFNPMVLKEFKQLGVLWRFHIGTIVINLELLLHKLTGSGAINAPFLY